MRYPLILAALVLVLPTYLQTSRPMTDGEVRQLIINDSIRSYSGSFPCPFNVDRDGDVAEADLLIAVLVARHRPVSRTKSLMV